MGLGGQAHTLEDELDMMEDDLDMMEDDLKMYEICHYFKGKGRLIARYSRMRKLQKRNSNNNFGHKNFEFIFAAIYDNN